MKKDLMNGVVITRRIDELSEAEQQHLERLCEIAHEKNERLKSEAQDQKRRYELMAQKKRNNTLELPLIFGEETVVIQEVDMDWRTTKLSLSRTVPIYIGLSIM